MTTNKKKRSKIRFLCENRFRRCAPAGCMPLPRAPVQRPTLTSTRGRRYTRSSEDTKRISLPENALATTATTRRWRVGTSCFQDSQKQPLSSSQTTPTGASLRSTTRARPPPVLDGIFVIYTHLHAHSTGTAGVSFYVHRMLPPKTDRSFRICPRTTSRNNSRCRPSVRAKTAGKLSLRDRAGGGHIKKIEKKTGQISLSVNTSVEHALFSAF